MPNPQVRKPPRRGRPEMSSKQREQMKHRISEVARGLFQQDGYAKISMRRIAKEIGCTPMTLYGYYEGKIDILRTLWGDVFEELFNGLREIGKDLDPQIYLKTLCVAYVKYWTDNADYYRLVFMAEGVTQPDVSLFLDNPDIVAQFGLFLEAIQNLGRDRQIVDTKPELDFLLSALHGIAHNKITISGYEWSSSEDQIHYAVRGIS